MTNAVFYFQVHQPYRLQRRAYFEKDSEISYFNDDLNKEIAVRVAERCYLPMNRLLLEAIEDTDGRFRCSFALTGTVLSQLEDWAPEALESFQELAETGCVEFICETAFHSLASHGDPVEFEAQVLAQRDRLTSLFGVRPVTFRNTELIVDESVASRIAALGFRVLLAEGADGLLAGRSARQVHRVGGVPDLKLLLRDYLFSDDIAFRFSNPEWESYPMMADQFATWLQRAAPEDAFVGMYMDYETFGEHQGPDTGIFEFMRHLPGYFLEQEGMRFLTPSQVAAEFEPVAEISIPDPVSWADAERDLSAWLGNPMQRDAHETLYGLAADARRAAELGHPELLRMWRKLTTSDHVYYMCHKNESDGDVHEYFTPYDSPHDSYIVFMDVLEALGSRIRAVLSASSPSS